MPSPPPWYAPILKALRAAAFFIAHAVLAILIIALVSLVQAVFRRLGDPELFGLIPLTYVFDVMDVAILGVFIFYGVAEAIKVFRE